MAKGENGRGDVWTIQPEKNNEHPAPFPVQLARLCVKASPCGVVYDPFMGSGTVAVAAMEEGRDWVGSEISKKYCDMAEKRIEQQKSKVSLYEPPTPITWF